MHVSLKQSSHPRQGARRRCGNQDCTSPIVIVVTPAGCGRFSARLEGAVLVEASRQPFLDACRALLALSVGAERIAIMRHAGSATNALSAQVGVAASLTVKEPEHGVPHFARWTAFSSSPVAPPIAQKGLGASP